jgi:hypothetical protein
MIDMRYKPYFLPQVSAPYTIVLQRLDDEDVDYDVIETNPEELNPSQGITLSDEVGNVELDDLNPIWVDNEMNVLDGHHRWVKAMVDNVPLKAVKINLNNKDACRILNKIQDIYEYEHQQGLEEVEMQSAINYYGDDENQFLTELEGYNTEIQKEFPHANEQTITAYRKNPIKENSAVGNFFTLSPIEGYSKYQIDFDNLLDTNALGVTYKDGQEPVDIIARIWFPHINFEKLGEQYNMPAINLKNKAVAEKAMKLGYDGIKYGDKLIQGLK